jgi:molybdate transport system ATP-binding protein
MHVDVAIAKQLREHDRRFDLDVRFTSDADVTILFGPSGAGKTQTLYALAGLARPDRGHVRVGAQTLFDSERRIDLPTRERRIGFVFQEYALFPHLNVLQNVAFARGGPWPLSLRSRRLADADADIRALVAAFELGDLVQSMPAQLSGGQRQRVALARALAAQPQLLLLDEPFAALDAPLRTRLRTELLAARARFGVPMIVITHDPDDVAALGGHVIAIENGKVSATA